MKKVMEKVGSGHVLCWLLGLTIFMDFLNGLCEGAHIGTIFRAVVILACFVAILNNSKRGAFYIGGIIVYLGLNVVLTFFKYQTYGGLFEDIKMAMRVSLYACIFCAAVGLYKNGKLTSQMLKTAVLVNLLYAPILFVVSGWIGIGSVSYSHGGVGFKSVFLSLNSINCALIVLYVFAVYNAFYNSNRRLWIAASVLVLIPMLMLGTKTSLLLVVAIPTICLLTTLKTVKHWGITVCGVLGLLALVILLAEYIPGTVGDAIRRQLHLFAQRDIVSYFFSGRNWMLDTAIEYAGESSGILDWLFGQGYFFSHHNLATITEYSNIVRPIEMDWADLVLAYGLPSLVFTYGHAGYVLYKTHSQRTSHQVRPYRFAMIILVAFSALAGHVFTEAISATFLAIAATSAFINAQEAHQPVAACEEIEKRRQSSVQLLGICVDDRFRFQKEENVAIPYGKKINADLLIKLLWMLKQSFGKREKVEILFVDEVRNKSMFENLYATIDHCPHDYRVINLGSGKSQYPHAKRGFVLPAVYMLAALVAHAGLYLCLPFGGWEWVNSKSSAVLIRLFQSYLKGFHGEKVKVYCMSDHHFFSCVACCDENLESHVIQHGVVLDTSYYYPILADHFLAWGEHTRKVQHEDPKVQVTGTYKFSKLNPMASNTGDKCLLYCVSITDTKVVAEKIINIMQTAKKIGFGLKIKMHPGSMFSTEELETRFKEDRLTFYKECAISDIDFDIAVIENSTVLVDLLFLNKPFVVYDNMGGYFSVYKDVPWCDKPEDLEESIKKAGDSDNEEVRKGILQQELNGGVCTIWG